MSTLAETRTAIARVNTGKNANEDSWMTLVTVTIPPAHDPHRCFSRS